MEAGCGNVVSTPYDDVFRTLLNDCSSLIIPVINEIFDERYRGDEEIVFLPETHFLNRQDGGEEKRITDASFKIVGREEKKFLYECQSTADSSMLVRIFEYSTQIALDQGEITGNRLRVEIPHSAVLFLRCKDTTPDKMMIEMRTPGGTVCFDVMVMKSQRYGIDEIFEKELLFLIPFHIFTYESHFAEYNRNKDKLEILKAEYIDIRNRLDSLMENGRISAYTRKIIMEMSDKVVENIARKYENVREGVKSVMGGKVLEHEAKTILREGWEQGRKVGHQEGHREGRREGHKEGRIEGENYGMKKGRLEQARETALNLRTISLDESTIAKMVNVSVELVREWFGEN